jgi:hypothetical protein
LLLRNGFFGFRLWIVYLLERYPASAGTVSGICWNGIGICWNGIAGLLERYQPRGFRGLAALLAKCRRCAPWAFFSTCTRSPRIS